jgi:hypothetical protein
MQVLPLELWFLIADLLDPQDLYKLIGVNRTFFEMIMNEVYDHLSFITQEPRVFSEKLKALQSSVMAERVRILTLWPSAVRDAIKAIDHEVVKVPERAASPKPMLYLQKVERLFGHVRPPERPMTPPRLHDPLPSPQERLEMFTSAMRSLKNVEELEVNWYLDNGSKTSAWHVPFFPDIWSSIGHKVRKLTMDIQLFKFDDVVKACGSMPLVEELYLTMRCDSALGSSGGTAVPYFINKFGSTLRVLSIKTIGHQELSAMFQLLGTFPHLTDLALVMPLDSYHLQDPSGFSRFLRDHPALRTLCLRYARCCKDCTDDGFKTHNGKHELYSGITLPALRCIELGLRIPIPQDGKSAMLNSVARLGKEITSLTLTDRSLTLTEVKSVLRYFPTYRLRKLSLFTQLLSPQLIDVLAKSCPDLNSLSLDVQTVVRSENETVERQPSDDVPGFTEALSKWAVDYENDWWRYRTWLLAEISIMKWEFKIGHTHSHACMNAIAAVVPSVRSFAGRGHMGPPDDGIPKPTTRRLLTDLDTRTKPFDT